MAPSPPRDDEPEAEAAQSPVEQDNDNEQDQEQDQDQDPEDTDAAAAQPDSTQGPMEDGGAMYETEVKEQDRWLPIANVARIMKTALPDNAKIAKEAKECMQECVSEFISFITSEASEKCHMEKRKTVNGEDILFAMDSTGFENYGAALKVYLARYRDSQNVKNETQQNRPSSGYGSSGGGGTGAGGGGQYGSAGASGDTATLGNNASGGADATGNSNVGGVAGNTVSTTAGGDNVLPSDMMSDQFGGAMPSISGVSSRAQGAADRPTLLTSSAADGAAGTGSASSAVGTTPAGGYANGHVGGIDSVSGTSVGGPVGFGVASDMGMGGATLGSGGFAMGAAAGR